MAFGSDAVNLLFRISADGSNAQSELKKISQSLQNEIGGASKSASAELDKLTGSFGASEAGLASLINPAALAAAGIVAIGSAAIVTGKFLFDLAEKGAEFGDSIYDATVKTGLSAESVSALALAASQSGVSLESAAGSVTKFERAVASAREGNKAAIESMERLFGKQWQTQTVDAETALDTVFKKIASLQDPYARVKAAQDAFGRSGIDVLKIIDQTGGSFEEFKKKASEAGLTLSKEDVQASNDFKDALAELEFQGKVLTTKFVSNYLPQLTNAIQSIESFFASHQEGIKSFGQAVSGVIKTLGELVQFVSDHPTLFRTALAVGTLGLSEVAVNAGQTFQQIGQDAQQGQNPNQTPQKKSPFVSDDDGYLDNKKDEQAAAKETYQKTISDAKEFSAERKVIADQELEDLKRNHEQNLTAISSFAADSKKYYKDIYDAQIKSINDQRAAIANAPDGAEKSAAEKLNKLKLDEAKALREYNKAVQKVDDDAVAERVKRLQDSFSALEAAQKEFDNDKIAQLRDTADKEGKGYATAAQEIYNIQFAALQRRRSELADELSAVGDNLKEKQRIQNEARKLDTEAAGLTSDGHRAYIEGTKKDLENEITLRERLNRLEEIKNNRRLAQIEDDARTKRITLVNAVDKEYDVQSGERIQKRIDLVKQASVQEGKDREDTNQRIKELDAESLAAFEDYQRRRRDAIIQTNQEETDGASRKRYADGTRPRVVSDEPITTQEGDETGLQKVFGGYGEQSDILIRQNGAIGGSFKDLGKTVKESAANMTGALQGAIEGYLLYGDSIGKVLKQAAAAELAHIASVSAIKAIYELAEGFAALFTNPAAAGAHFTAATIYGAAAVASGIGARALSASSRVNSATSAANSSGTVSNSASTTTQNSTSSESRKQSEELSRSLTIHVTSDDSHIVKVVDNNVRDRGDLHGTFTTLVVENQ